MWWGRFPLPIIIPLALSSSIIPPWYNMLIAGRGAKASPETLGGGGGVFIVDVISNSKHKVEQ
jgi:hypothetical protein